MLEEKPVTGKCERKDEMSEQKQRAFFDIF